MATLTSHNPHKAIKIIEKSINMSYYRSLNCSPEELEFGKSSMDPLERKQEIELTEAMARDKRISKISQEKRVILKPLSNTIPPGTKVMVRATEKGKLIPK